MHAVLQRRFTAELLRRHNDVAGYLFSAVGVLYAVVLGFVVVVVWQKYDETVANVENEVDAAADVYHVVDGFPTRRVRTVRVKAQSTTSITSFRSNGRRLTTDRARTRKRHAHARERLVCHR